MSKPKSDLKTSPWTIKSEYVSTNFVLVTPDNIKNAKVLGRVFYIWEVGEKISTYLGHIDLRPRIVPCRLQVVKHPLGLNFVDGVWVKEEETREDYEKFGKQIVKYMNDKMLFVRMSDTIINYFKI